MKNNFYLQHPLMAVKDARMKVLIKKEKLRGFGAYWFIMEQLGMQPGQRATLEDIRPFCNQDIPFAYLKRIICEYQLFAFDEDGFFTPEELNPTPKKPAKKARKSAKSQPKNDENQQKVSKISTNPLEENSDNSLNNGNLAKNKLIIKENIKDIITTATTEEKEETAAVAVRLHPVRPWQELADGLLNENSAWLEIAFMRSGYAALLKRHLKAAVEMFKNHIIAYCKGGDMLEMRDIQSYFINYVNAGSRTSKALHEALTALDAKVRADNPNNTDEPYRYEQFIDGRRTYQGCPIPDDAPPRPDETAFWDEEQHGWTTGKGKKGKR